MRGWTVWLKPDCMFENQSCFHLLYVASICWLTASSPLIFPWSLYIQKSDAFCLFPLSSFLHRCHNTLQKKAHSYNSCSHGQIIGKSGPHMWKTSYESFEWVHVSGRHKHTSPDYYVVSYDPKRMDLKSLGETFLFLMICISNRANISYELPYYSNNYCYSALGVNTNVLLDNINNI